MSDILGLSSATKQELMEAIAARLDGGAVKFYTSPRPATADTAITSQTLLLSVDLPDPAGTVTAGAFEGAAIDVGVGTADGNAAWCRVVDSTAAAIGDGDVGLTGSGAFATLDSLAIVVGGEVTVTGLALAFD